MKLYLKNVKGQNESYNLAKTNILIGPYGSGKSTVIQAMKFLIEGTLTDGGITRKTNEELFKLASGDTMEVVAELNGEVYTRGVEQNVKSGETTYKKIGSNTNVVTKATQTEILSSITTDFGVDSSVLNFSEFAKLSATDQKKYIFGLYPPNFDKWNEDQILLFLVTRMSEDFEAEQITSTCKEVAKICITKGVNAAIEYVTAKFNDYNAQKKKDDVGMQELTRIRQENTESVKGLSKLVEDQKLLADQIGEISKRVSEAKQKNRDVLKNSEERARLLYSIRQIEEKISQIQKPIEQPDAPIKDDTELVKQREDTDCILTSLKIDLLNATEQLTEQKEVLDAYCLEIDIQDELLLEETAELSRREERIRGIKTTLAQLKEFSGKRPLCTVVECKTDMTPAIVGLQAELEMIEAAINDSLGFVTNHNNIIAQMTEEKLKQVQLITDQSNLIESIKVSIADYTSKIATIDSAIERLEIENKMTLENNALRKDNFAKSLQEIAERQQLLNSQIETANLAIEEIDKLDTKIYDVELIELEYDAVNQRLVEVNEQIRVKVKAKSDLENLAKKELEAEETAHQFLIYKALKDAVGQKGLAGQMIVEAIEPMINGVQQNLDALGIKEQFYVDTEKFNFGLGTDGNQRSFETLSNGETLILTAAIVIEFMQKTCKNRILLLDNLNDIDAQSALWFIKGIHNLNSKYDICVMAANFTDDGLIQQIENVENINVIKKY